jgi:hypothetical protein
MTMQRLCHPSLCLLLSVIAISSANSAPPVHDYPTQARVEYVNECIANHGDSLANVYQCSCAIDKIANQLSYDDFVEAVTFARYAGLPGEGGGLFRDSDKAKTLARMFRQLEADAFKACGLAKS